MSEASRKEDREAKMMAVLNRHADIGALDALIYAYKHEPRETRLAETAIVLDSSVFLRLGSYVDVVDYLHTAHLAPLILPGQSVQEFWNNDLSVSDPIAAAIKKRLD